MHRLQKDILYRLMTNPSLRYARLKPKDIEGNLFTYHLRTLMRSGLVQKDEAGLYELSAEGKLYVDKLSLETLMPRIQPKIITLLAIQDDRERWLMYRRSRQPFIHQVGMPYGKIHLSENIHAAAIRELREKAGLTAELQHRGDGYIAAYEGGKLISQVMFHLFYGHGAMGDLRKKSNGGENFWLRESELDDYDLLPGVRDILWQLKRYNRERFFVELEYQE